MRSRRHVLTRLLRLALPFWRWIALSVLLGFLTIASSIGLLASSAWIISKAALRPSIADIQVAIVGVRFFGIARGVFRYLERLVSHNTTFKLLAEVRVWFYARLEPLAPARLMQYRSGDLLSRIMNDVNTLEDFYVRVIAPPLVAVAVGVMMAILMGSYAPVLAAVVLAFMLLQGVGVPLLVQTGVQQPGSHLLDTQAELSAALVDGVGGMADLLAYGAGEAQLRRVADLNAALTARQRRLNLWEGLQAGLGVVIASLAVVAVLWTAIPLVEAAQLNGVHLATLALATMAAFEAVLPLPQTATYLDDNLAAADRLLSIVEAAPAVVDPAIPIPPTLSNYDLEKIVQASEPPPRPSPASRGGSQIERADSPSLLAERGLGGEVYFHRERLHLAIKHLSFTYPGTETPALADVSFTVQPGQRVAVVGPSGAGKSTLVNLLLRFWDVPPGQIMLGGHDLRAYRADDVRAMIGVVAQRTHLFNTTIRENLLLAREDAPAAAINAALSGAQLTDFIAGLPDGLETRVGEDGFNLSGGERQRIAIARALIKDAPLIILDEATANLDPVTERAILADLEPLLAGRTALQITHRLIGLERADQIIVLDQGRVVEAGTHEALLDAGVGLYCSLYEQQRAQTILDTPPSH